MNTKTTKTYKTPSRIVSKKRQPELSGGFLAFRKFLKKRTAIIFMVLFAGSASLLLNSVAAANTVLATVEAETMILSTGASVVTDTAASGGNAIKLAGSNGTATGQFSLTLPATSLIVRAKGVQCKGAPQMVVKVDGVQVLVSSVSATSWSETYTAAVNLTAASHSLSIAFTNYINKGGCSRQLYVDKITLLGQEATGYTYTRPSNPDRTQARDSQGNWLATFTDGARTVALAGSARTFAEPAYTTATVNSQTWVRVLPTPFSGQVDEAWLTQKLADTSPDILQTGMQYIYQAPTIYDGSLRIAGDADYGPLQSDGTRAEGSDFNDYLGLPWTYGTTTDQPESSQFGSLDCSGFQRMVWGYRSGLPLALDPDGAGIPRRSFQIYDFAPGIIVVQNTGAQVTDFSKLQPGDLVFQDAATDDGTQIDHLGIYLGLDSAGEHRFLSSRKKVNGPTMGDYYGKSVLNGTGLYATSFRGVRRL